MKLIQPTFLFDPISAHPCGMDAPFHVCELTYEDHLGYSQVTIRDRETGNPGATFIVAQASIDAYTSQEAQANGEQPRETWSACHDMPQYGWIATEIKCWQTGGFCMVDVLTFANGWTATITDEAAFLWAPDEEILGDVEIDDARYVSLCWPEPVKRRWYATATWDDFPEGGSYGTVIEAYSYSEVEPMLQREMALTRMDETEQDEDMTEEQQIEKLIEDLSGDWRLIDCFDLDAFIKRHQRT